MESKKPLDKIDLRRLPDGEVLADFEEIVQRYCQQPDAHNERAATFSRLARLLRKQIEVSGQISMQTNIEDLGIDSLEFAELGAELETEFNVIVPPEFRSDLEDEQSRRPIQRRDVLGIRVETVVDWIMQQRVKSGQPTSASSPPDPLGDISKSD